MAADTVRPIDRAALSRVLQRAARAPEPPWLHGEVARRMADRLPIVKAKPAVVLDWWARTGAGAGALRRVLPKARVLPVEPQAPAAAPGWWARWRGEAAPLAAEAVAPAAAQLVWANMMLHAVPDPAALLARWKSALAVDGFLMFSTLGPDTLKTLRAVYADAGWGPPHAPFVDMHDLGDMLVRAGFADPVMDQELLRLTWPTPAALLAELRTLGANADPQRAAGLRTPRWRARLEAALAARAGADGRIALEFEIVYGHAFNPPPRLAVQAETRLSATELQRMARTGRRGG
jgi:malonyl-CoA O-methyltransferase